MNILPLICLELFIHEKVTLKECDLIFKKLSARPIPNSFTDIINEISVAIGRELIK